MTRGRARGLWAYAYPPTRPRYPGVTKVRPLICAANRADHKKATIFGVSRI